MWKSRFSHNAPKTLIFHVLLRGKASFLMTRQKGANLLHCYVSKQVFSWRAKNSYILCIVTWKNRFSHDAIKGADFLHYYVEKQVFSWQNRKQSVYLMHYYVSKQVFSWRDRKQSVYKMHCYVSKQVFSWRAKYSYIWCIITWKSRFSNDSPKKCKFVALLRFEAGFLMMRQKLLYLMQYYVEKQVFLWRAKNSYIWCIVTWKNRFSHDAPKRCNFVALLRGKADFLMTWPKTKCIQDALLRFKAGFLMTRQILLYLLPYYVEKQVFSWRTKNSYIWCIITWKSSFSHDAPKSANVLPYYVEKQVFS